VAEPNRPTLRSFRFALVTAVCASTLLWVGVPAGAAPFPALPVAYGATFLSNLSGPDLAPGGSGTISFQVADPGTFGAISSVVLTLDVYAFNAFPGNATSQVTSAGTPVLVTSGASATEVNVSMDPLAPGHGESGSVGVVTSASTPTGTFAVRTALAFVANGTPYRLESRGWFSDSLWAAATELPNGSLTLNLTTLGVSGVVAETSILVSSSNWDWALGLILGASIVLVGAGAFVYFRRESKSSSGAR